ncbi:superoxide dismutase family protein [Streptosporangium sp. NPDC050855]|uniref:superoxide dismutase family protein n=1 Tax=Streptosporangium sp. NPDC050855 TaxID=3366194 RepID=UPI0037876E54
MFHPARHLVLAVALGAGTATSASAGTVPPGAVPPGTAAPPAAVSAVGFAGIAPAAGPAGTVPAAVPGTVTVPGTVAVRGSRSPAPPVAPESPSPSGTAGSPRAGAAGAEVKGVKGETLGELVVEEMAPGRTRLTFTVKGLTPGYHGFHVHTKGICDAASKDPATGSPFFSAGPHFSLRPGDHPSHSGDLPDLLVGRDGEGGTIVMTDRFTVAQLLDGDGSAIVVHALADNQANVPERYAEEGVDETTRATGDSGGRVACGVITRR